MNEQELELLRYVSHQLSCVRLIQLLAHQRNPSRDKAVAEMRQQDRSAGFGWGNDDSAAQK